MYSASGGRKKIHHHFSCLQGWGKKKEGHPSPLSSLREEKTKRASSFPNKKKEGGSNNSLEREGKKPTTFKKADVPSPKQKERDVFRRKKRWLKRAFFSPIGGRGVILFWKIQKGNCPAGRKRRRRGGGEGCILNTNLFPRERKPALYFFGKERKILLLHKKEEGEKGGTTITLLRKEENGEESKMGHRLAEKEKKTDRFRRRGASKGRKKPAAPSKSHTISFGKTNQGKILLLHQERKGIEHAGRKSRQQRCLSDEKKLSFSKFPYRRKKGGPH